MDNNNTTLYSPTSNEIESGGFFSRGNILKLIVGIIVVTSLGFFIYAFILPIFRPTTTEKITLKYWGLWEDPNIMGTIIDEFKRQNPNVDIKYEKQDIKSLGNYVERLATRTQNQTGPDIFRFHNSWTFRLKNILLPLSSDVINSAQVDTQYYDVIKKDLKINGAYYGIPLEVDTLSLFINEEIFKSAGITSYPTTWDDFVTTARQLTVKDATGKITTAGVAMGTYDNVAHASDILSLLFIQNGADLTDLAGKKKKNAEDALDFYTCFAKDSSSDCIKVWDNSQDNSRLAFAKGNLAMYFGYSWDVFEIKRANPDLSFIITSVPHLAGTSSFRNNTIASYWVEGISSKTKHPKEALEFLKYLSSKESLEKLFTVQSKGRIFGEPYPRRDLRNSLSTNPLIYPFVSQADNATSSFFSSDTYDNGVTAVLNGYLANSIRSVLANTLSSASAIETLANGVSLTIAKYGN